MKNIFQFFCDKIVILFMRKIEIKVKTIPYIEFNDVFIKYSDFSLF